MSDAADPSRPRPPLFFFLALAALALVFLVLGIVRANRTTLRGDEVVTLFWNRESQTVGDMIANGAVGQVSPAPLYYLVARAVDASRVRLNYLGLNYSGYYRLPALLFTTAFGVAAAVLLALRLRKDAPAGPVPWVLLLCGVALFWFHPKVFAFAGTDRPYALWNGLWILTLAWMLCRPESNLGLAVLLTLMASTATAACFQILAVGVAFALVRRLDGRPAKEILIDGIRVFAVPAAVGAYYAFRSGSADRESDTVLEMLGFWLVTNLPAWIGAGLACALVFRPPKRRDLAVPVLAFTTLLALLPAIYFLATLKGYSSPSRQYLWTSAGLPLALFAAALCWERLRAWRPATPIALVLAVGLVAGFSIATLSRPARRNDSRTLALLDPGSPLRQVLRSHRPDCLLALPPMGDIERKNLRLLAEWIAVRCADLPFRPDAVLPIRDADGRLLSIPFHEGLVFASGSEDLIPVKR